MRKTAFLSLCIVMLCVRPSFTAETYDPQITILALNMAVVSVHRITAAQDRVILDREYYNIINNLSLGTIRADSEITQLYEKLLDITSRKKLRSQEADYIRKNFDEKSKNSISSALRDLGKSSAAMIREDGSIRAFFGSFSSLVSVSAASYFNYQSGGVTLQGSLEDNIFRLNAQDLADFNDLQKQLLSSSWNLLSRYNLSDDYRLVQSSIDDFCKAIEETDSHRKLRMLQALEADFRAYPPYWYYRANAAQECRDSNEAAKCFDVFEEVWRPVLRRDPYMLEAAKYRINERVKDFLPEDESSRQTLLELCRIMRENTMRDDWVNNLFAGAVYYALGEKEEGIKCAQLNIDFGFEQELSAELLRIMKAGTPAGLMLREALRALRLNELTAEMTSRDKTTALLIADCFDGREGANDLLTLGRKSPAALHALRLAAFGAGDFREIRSLAESQPVSGDEVSHDYAVIMPLVKGYADDNNSQAQAFLGDMYLYGFAVSQDIERAKSYYLSAAENGHKYSQVMYINLMLQSRIEPEQEKQTPSEQNEPQKKKKKPFIRLGPFRL